MMAKSIWTGLLCAALAAIACGEEGDVGPLGPAGDPGADGPAGPTGPAGMDGQDGMNGQDGMDGMDGQDGVAGQDGQDGMDGMDGQDGQDGVGAVTDITGTVSTGGGPVGVGTPVFLVAIDDRGEPFGQFGGTLTDANGEFSLSVDDGVFASSRLVMLTQVDDVPLRAIVSSTVGLAIDPVSTGVFEATLLITETDGGRSLDDFTAAEIDDVYDRSAATLTTAGTDLADADAVLQQIIRGVGGVIADYSGGMFTAVQFVQPVPADVAVPVSLDYDLVTGGGAIYDIDGNGEVGDGQSANGQDDGCDDCFQLNVDGSVFPSSAAVLEDGNEVRLGPATMAGLSVTRRVWGDPVDNLIRYTETLENPTTSTITVDVRIDHNLGADGSTQIVTTSSGDETIDTSDRWIAFNDADITDGDPTTTFWFGVASDVAVDLSISEQLQVSYNQVAVPPNGQVSIVHYGAFYNDPPDAAAFDRLNNVGQGPNFAGMRPVDLATNITQVPVPPYSVIGEAGAVASFAEVTVTNTGTVTLTNASSDGSFNVFLGGTAGQSIIVSATDGTSATLTLP